MVGRFLCSLPTSCSVDGTPNVHNYKSMTPVGGQVWSSRAAAITTVLLSRNLFVFLPGTKKKEKKRRPLLATGQSPPTRLSNSLVWRVRASCPEYASMGVYPPIPPNLLPRATVPGEPSFLARGSAREGTFGLLRRAKPQARQPTSPPAPPPKTKK
jgi:hypothetical protein